MTPLIVWLLVLHTTVFDQIMISNVAFNTQAACQADLAQTQPKVHLVDGTSLECISVPVQQ